MVVDGALTLAIGAASRPWGSHGASTIDSVSQHWNVTADNDVPSNVKKSCTMHTADWLNAQVFGHRNNDTAMKSLSYAKIRERNDKGV